MPSSASLLNLPTEVRLIIWSYLLVDEWIYISPCNSTPEPHKPLHHQEHLPAIMRTCYELQQETAPVYYSSVHVHFDVLPGVRPTCLVHWLDDIGEAYARLVRKFQMRWNCYVDVSLELNKSGSSSSRSSRIHPRMQAEDDEDTTTITHPPKTIHIAPTYTLRIQAVIPPPFFFFQFFSPKTTSLPLHHPAQFWKLHGTADFCRTLTHNLARELNSHHHHHHTETNNTAARGAPPLLSLLEERMENFVMGFVDVVDDHAQALRWLGYW